MRCYNDYKYPSKTLPKEMAFFANPQDLSLYQTDISGVKVEHIQGKYLNGFKITPDEPRYEWVIVVFGGSEGSPNYATAVDLAKQWFQVLSLFYFGMPNQQWTLAEVPVEYFSEIETYIYDTYGKGTKITLHGTSKWAEYALLLASYYPSISNVILYAPSAYVFSGLDFQKMTSSWSKDGKPLDYVDVNHPRFGEFMKNIMWPYFTKWPVRYEPSYTNAVGQDENRESKRIKGENIKANIVIFAGDKDQVWNSVEMWKEIYNNRPENTKLFIYEWAGHAFHGNGVISLGDMRMAAGWTEEANNKTWEQNAKDIMEILKSWHNEIKK